MIFFIENFSQPFTPQINANPIIYDFFTLACQELKGGLFYICGKGYNTAIIIESREQWTKNVILQF